MQAPAVQALPISTIVIADYFQYEGGRYQRYKKLLEFKAGAISLAVQAINFTTKVLSPINTLGYVRIDMGVQAVSIDGVIGPMNVRAAYAIKGTESAGTLTGAFGDEPDGPILLTLFGVNAQGVSTKLISHGAYLNRTGAAKDHPYCWIQNNTRNWETIKGWNIAPAYQYALAKVADLKTTRVKPVTRPVGPAFNVVKTAGMLTRIELVPSDSSQNSGSHLQISPSGISHTECRQNYAYADLVLKWPVLPLLDGPRGVCTTPYTTDLVMGRKGKTYGANPWQRFVIDWAGNKRTLYGLRHPSPPTWNYTKEGGPEVEIVGDWDPSIPVAERFAWESWSMSWDQRSLFPIADNDPIPPGETEHPHASATDPKFGGPVHFTTDRHGYILRVAFDGKSHATPAKIVRWCKVDDPWAVECLGAFLYVTERGQNRISIWSADTPNTYLGDLIADPTASVLGKIDQQNRWWVGADYPQCRTHPIVAPEGLAYLDGYVYFGSSALHEVRRIPVAPGPNGYLVATGPYEVVCRPTFNEKSFFVYLKASPGTFGPRGTIAITTWSIATFGRPELFLPTPGRAADGAFKARVVTSDGATPILGKTYAAGANVTVYDALDKTGAVTGTYATQVEAQRANGTPLSHSVLWNWQTYVAGLIQGRGRGWESDSYGSALAFSPEPVDPPRPDDPPYGALACSSANGNISVYCAADDALDGPPLTSAQELALRRGTTYYQVHNETLHGSFCGGPDWPLPWGENPDQDAFMRACGYSPDQEDPEMIAELQATITTLQSQIQALSDDRDAQKVRADTAEGKVTTLTDTLAQVKAKLQAEATADATADQARADALALIG